MCEFDRNNPIVGYHNLKPHLRPLGNRVGAGIMRQQDTLLHHHHFLVIDSPWCSKHNLKIWAVIHTLALRYAKYIAKIGSAENRMVVKFQKNATVCKFS